MINYKDMSYYSTPGIDIFVKPEIFVTRTVCEIYNKFPLEIIGNRKRENAEIKQICSALLVLKYDYSYQKAGQYYGITNHTTVMHSIETVFNLLDTNKNFKQKVGHLFEGVKIVKNGKRKKYGKGKRGEVVKRRVA